MGGNPVSELPAYADVVSEDSRRAEAGPTPRLRWPYRLIGVLGVAMVAVPLVLGMFLRAAQGQQMLDSFAPYLSDSQIASLRTDLATVEQARDTILAQRANGTQPSGSYPYVDALVRDYPGIRTDMSGMVDSMGSEVGDYDRLSSLPPFGLFPWFFALPGVALIVVGVVGVRRAAVGRPARASTVVALLIAIGLIVAPAAAGVFTKSPAAQGLIDRFAPIMTHERVRTIQGYFVTLVGGAGELDSRYLAALPAHADRSGIEALRARWQPMTARFADLIGAMNDNITNFDGIVALNNSTKPLGFPAFRQFGWFFVIPGVVLLAAIASTRSSRSTRSKP